MFNKKQLYLIGALALVLSLALVQAQVRAAWENPIGGPIGTETNPPLTNPLEEDLDLGDNNIINGASATFSSGTFNGLDLKSGNIVGVNNINVSTINGAAPGGGGIKNPLEANLSGNNLFGVEKLMGCDPASGRTCSAIEGQAGKSTRSDSFALGVYGYTQAASGSYPSYGVYGLAQNLSGVGVYGYATEKNAYGVYGVARDKDGIGGSFRNLAVGGTALSATGATELNGNLNVIGDSTLTGDFNVVGSSDLNGAVGINGMVTINGEVMVSAGEYGIYAIADSAADGGFAGVQGVGGEVGVAGSGPIGVMGDGFYGGIFSGERLEGWGPPPPGGWGNPPPSDDPLFSLFGVNKTLATVNDPGYIGLVAAGGYMYGGSFSNAGLGLCAISGELIHDEVDDSNYFAYCQDAGGKNNYAGFFAGDVYIKKGSIQINDTLAAAGENLIYGNVVSAAAGSSLLKLQTGGVDKFKVDKDGASTFSNLILNKPLVAGESLIYANLISAAAGSNLIDLQVSTSTKFRVTRDGAATFGSSITAPANLILNGNGSYINFDGNGNAWPTCNQANDGMLYYGKTNHVLCSCYGTPSASSWQALDRNFTDAACSNIPTAPDPLR